MKKIYFIVFSILLVFSFTQTLYAKTTVNVSIKKHNINISNNKLLELTDMVKKPAADAIVDVMKEELTDLIVEELIKLIYEDLYELLTEDEDNNGVFDLTEDLIEIINDELTKKSEKIIKDATAGVKSGVQKAVDEAIDKYISSAINRVLKLIGINLAKEVANVVEDIVESPIKNAVNQLPTLVNDNLQSLMSILVEQVPDELAEIVNRDIPQYYHELVDREIPIIVEDLIYKYLPRDFSMLVASLDVKSDINDFFAIGGGVKAISIETAFIPEIYLSTYLKIINEPNFDFGIMLSGQALFLPFLDDIYALNAGLFFNYQISNSFYLEGELMAGTFISEPFGITDSVPLVGGYNFGLVFDVTEHMHIKAGYSVHGFSELAVAGLKYFLMDELEVGTFSFSIGCHF